jgi:two-component system NtrC family sensor kinase
MYLKIWHKMIIGIAIPSFIALVGGFISIEYIMNVQKRQGYELIADNLRDHVLEVRRIEKNFFHFKNKEQLDNLHYAITLLNKSIDAISPDTVSEIGKRDFSRLQKTIRTYPNFVAKLYDNYQHESAVTEEVRTEGRKLEAFVVKGKDISDLTTSFILHMRLMEKNYMLFRDKESYLRLNDALLKLKNVTPFCDTCGPYIEAIHNLFTTYQISDRLSSQIQITGNKFEEITGRMATREREKISSFLTKTKLVLVAALILLMTLGPLLVYKTASYIVAPIKRLGEITRKISEGDMYLRAPLREHDETYDLAKSFNTMLDKLHLTHHSLETSMELLKQKQAQLVESEKRASLGLLVSGVAHELNNPLYNISLTASAMREEAKELGPEEIDEYTHDILMESKRAHTIVEDLLDFARARKSTEMIKQDIAGVLRESIRLVANQLKINKIALQREIPESELFIKGNQSKLEQIFVSIFTNAIQAMKSNGTLNVSLRVDTDNDTVVIKISDTGPGIPKEDIKNIFEPFFTTKPVGEGTGLGLSVCRSLVQEHQGEIEVESTLGEGTTFIIKMPRYKETAEAS